MGAISTLLIFCLSYVKFNSFPMALILITICSRERKNENQYENIYLCACVCVTYDLIHSGKHNRYDSSQSGDYREHGHRFKVTYGSGGVVGFTSIDTITVSCANEVFFSANFCQRLIIMISISSAI